MKTKDILQILENQIDKIVLGLMVLISMVLLWLYVIGNPYGVKVDGRKRAPGDIDRYIKQVAERAVPETQRPAEPVPYDQTFLAEYTQYVQSSCPKIASLSLPCPGESEVVVREDRTYALPTIPPLTEVAVASLRGAAQLPTDEVGPDQPYKMVAGEIGDVDLVTVSARFNAQILYNNFLQSFKNPRLKSSWQDAALARPVLARLELQRRTLQSDGNWGEWETLPRTKIDSYKKMLEELPESLEQSQYSVDLWKSQFDNTNIQLDIMQPEAYLYTISRIKWMPPKYLDEALEILKKQEQTQERQRREELTRMRTTQSTPDTRRPTTERRTTTRPQTQPRSRPGARGGEAAPDMFGFGLETPAMTPRPEVRKERTVADVEKDMQKDMLTDKSSIETIKEPVLVWAHDDTAAPGRTYQYRLRLGVFNPIAGKDWFQSDQVAYKNQTILWSNYTEPTAAMYVPRRIYAFPMDVITAKDGSNGIEGVKVEVDKYYLGRWRDFEFDVYPGQIIGSEVEDVDKINPQTPTAVMGEFINPMMDVTTDQPTKVDFTTQVMLVDVYPQAIWGKRPIYQALYYDLEQKLRQMAIGKGNWSAEIRREYDEIQNAKQQAVEQRGTGMMEMMPFPGMMPGGI
jgi:hypothetical protein